MVITVQNRLFMYDDDSVTISSCKIPIFIAREMGSDLNFTINWLIDNKLSYAGKADRQQQPFKVCNFQITFTPNLFPLSNILEWFLTNMCLMTLWLTPSFN